MIYALLSKKNVALRTFMGQIAQDAWIGGRGQPNLGNAWILGKNGMALPPLART